MLHPDIHLPGFENLEGVGKFILGRLLRDLIAVGHSLAVVIAAKVGGHISEHTQAQEDPIEADDAATSNGHVHQR